MGPAPSSPPTVYENNKSNLLEIVKALTAQVDSMSNQLVAAIEKQIELGAQAHEEVTYYEKEKLQLMHRQGEQGVKQHNEEIHLLRRIVKSCYPPPSPVYPPPPTAPPTTAAPPPTTGAPHPTTAAPHPTTAAPHPTTAAPRPTTAAPYPTTTLPAYKPVYSNYATNHNAGPAHNPNPTVLPGVGYAN